MISPALYCDVILSRFVGANYGSPEGYLSTLRVSFTIPQGLDQDEQNDYVDTTLAEYGPNWEVGDMTLTQV